MIAFVFWYWWIAAAIFLGLEMLSPGFFFLWMGVSAFITGLLFLVMPFMSPEFQLLIFAVLSMVSAIWWKNYLNRHPIETDHPHLNQRGAEYLGKNFTLITAIENGRGRVKVNDSTWRVEGEDCPAGATVKVIAVDGASFKVIRVN